MMDPLELTKSSEDYLETMYILEKTDGKIRIKDIAQLLQVKPPSVVEALKKLSEMNLITYEKYGKICLTREGVEIAENIINRHEILKNFLETLGVDLKIANSEACAMEHILSISTVNKLKKLVEFIETNNVSDDLQEYCK